MRSFDKVVQEIISTSNERIWHYLECAGQNPRHYSAAEIEAYCFVLETRVEPIQKLVEPPYEFSGINDEEYDYAGYEDAYWDNLIPYTAEEIDRERRERYERERRETFLVNEGAYYCGKCGQWVFDCIHE